MDYYTTPLQNTYITSWTHWYQMPIGPNGDTKTVISVPTSQASYFTVLYTILVTILFAGVAQIVVDLVLAFYPLDGTGNRIMLLVGFYNSNGPITAALLMLEYAYLAIFRTTKKRRRRTDWNALKWSLLLALVATTVFTGSNITKFFVSGRELLVRNGARVNPDAIVYLAPDREAGPQASWFYDLRRVRLAACMLALGRLESSRRNVDKSVRFRVEETENGRGRRFEFSYSLTGFEMGLQLAAGLRYHTEGSCETDYSLYNKSASMGTTDRWDYFGGSFAYNSTPWREQNIPPFVGALPDISAMPEDSPPEKVYEYLYGIIPHTAMRASQYENPNDPWYLTEPNPNANTTFQELGRFRVRRGRPGLMCRQRQTFSLGGKTVYIPQHLNHLPGLRMSKFMRDTVFAFEFSVPAILTVIDNLSASSLASSFFFTVQDQSLDASRSRVEDDMKRLVDTTFLYTRELVRNIPLLFSTLKADASTKGLENAASSNGKVPYESADIILDSPEVSALSVTVLLAVPLITFAVWILIGYRMWFFRPKIRAESDRLVQMNLRAIALQSTQLYRFLDENVSGARKWSGRLGLTPYIKEIETPKNGGASLMQTDSAEPPNDDEGLEPYVLPQLKLAKMELVATAEGSGVPGEKQVGLSEESRPKNQRGNSMGSDISENQGYDLVMTRDRNRRLNQMPPVINWSDIQTDHTQLDGVFT